MSDRRQQLLAFIAIYQDLHGYGPSIREMMGGMGLASPSTVQFHLAKAVRDGLVTHEPGRARTWRVVPKAG